jgi:hypothetical protein
MSKTLSKIFGQLSILNNTENQMITDQKSSKQSENSVPATLEDIKVSLIEELSKILKKRVNTYQTAEHIERIFDVMSDRVGTVTKNIENLKNRKEEHKYNLQLANNIVAEIRRYFINISQSTSKYFRANEIEKRAIDLNKELNSIIQILGFYLMVDFNERADENNEKIKQDIEELSKVIC